MLVKCAYKGFKFSLCGSGILKKIWNEIFEVNSTWGLDLLGIKNMYLEVFIVGSCLPYVKHHMGLKEYTNCVFVNTNSISNGFFNCWWCTQIVLYAMLCSIYVGRSGCHLTTILTFHGWQINQDHSNIVGFNQGSLNPF